MRFIFLIVLFICLNTWKSVDFVSNFNPWDRYNTKLPLVESNESNISQSQQTATDAYLKFFLGDKYIEHGENADKKNVFMLLRISSADQKILSNEAAIGAMLNAMKKEREMKDWIVFYHSQYHRASFNSDVFDEFRKVLLFFNVKFEDFHFFRPFVEPFAEFANAGEFAEKQIKNVGSFANIHDYADSFTKYAISANIFLFGNHNNLKEFTVHYFANNYTARPEVDLKLIMVLNDFCKKYGAQVKQYNYLYDNFFPKENDLMQIFVCPDHVNEITYLSDAFGRVTKEFDASAYPENEYTYKKHLEKYIPLKFITTVRNAAHDQYHEESKMHTLALIQARLYLKPRIITDSTKVKFMKYRKTQPPQKYWKLLRNEVVKDVLKYLNNLPSTQKPKVLPSQQDILNFLREYN
jgi:hypothetical protein